MNDRKIVKIRENRFKRYDPQNPYRLTDTDLPNRALLRNPDVETTTTNKDRWGRIRLNSVSCRPSQELKSRDVKIKDCFSMQALKQSQWIPFQTVG